MFAETLIKARTNSQTPSGSIRVVSELQWMALSQIYHTTNSINQLRETLRTNPWDVAVFSNPSNLSPKQISKEIESIGASSFFKIIIRKLPTQISDKGQ